MNSRRFGAEGNLLRFFVIAISFAVAAAHADTLTGRVASVETGDTITLRDADEKLHRIRISGIHAPVLAQPYGNRSRGNLTRLLENKGVTAVCDRRDQDGNQVCKVWVRPDDCKKCGRTLDVGHAQIISGMVWWCRHSAMEQSPEERGRYASTEHEARARRIGLWQDPRPAPPWDWGKPVAATQDFPLEKKR